MVTHPVSRKGPEDRTPLTGRLTVTPPWHCNCPTLRPHEMRMGEIPDTEGVEVFCWRQFSDETVDLNWVGRVDET